MPARQVLVRAHDEQYALPVLCREVICLITDRDRGDGVLRAWRRWVSSKAAPSCEGAEGEGKMPTHRGLFGQDPGTLPHYLGDSSTLPVGARGLAHRAVQVLDGFVGFGLGKERPLERLGLARAAHEAVYRPDLRTREL